MKRKTAAITSIIVLAVCSCARFGKESAVGMPQGFTIVPVRESIVRLIPAGEMTDTPSFVTSMNPFSAFQAFPFHLPADARTRVELMNDRGDRVATLADERMKKGVYQIQVGGPNSLENRKKYTLRLIVDKKPAGTRDFSIYRPEVPRPGEKTAELPPGVTITPVNVADVQPLPGTGNTGGPAFGFRPSPDSITLRICFVLPADARTRIELRDSGDNELSALVDERMSKGAYELSFGRQSSAFAAGDYMLRLFVEKKFVKTWRFTILK